MSQRKRWRADPAVRLALDLAGRTLLPERSNLPGVLEQLRCSVRMTASALTTLQRTAAYPAAHARLQASLPMTLHSLRGWVDQAMANLSVQIAPAPVLAGTVLAELRALEEEFGELSIESDLLSVQTGPIVLEEVALGAFRIELNLDRLKRGYNDPAQLLFADALDPNPASADDRVTHPHVREGIVCLGDALMPIKLALRQGRLFDVMQMVRSVLNTYNDASAYVALEEWDGRLCDDCGQSTSADETATCSHCDQVLCQDCSRSCDACGTTLCGSCLYEAIDDEQLCERCQGTCAQCDNTVRRRDLEDGLCPTCREEQEQEIDDEDPDTVTSAPQTHPDPGYLPTPDIAA